MGKNPLSLFWADWRRRLPYRRFGEVEDRSRRLAAQAFAILTLTVGAVYLVWLGNLVWRGGGGQDVLFLLSEGLAFLLLVLLGFDVCRLRYHRAEGLAIETRPPVDILVPCYGEPYEVIRTTLRAVSRIPYQPVQVYVLDDANSPLVASLAQSLGFHHHSRLRAGLPLEDSKAGNLNFGLGLSRGELILVLDADQVPDPDILERLVGFFRLPRVAFVQSKQEFFLPEGDPFFNRDEIFYDTVQLSNDQANAVVSCGSGVVYHRRALAEVGGFATWNLVEDLTTSYELLSRGWKGIYFPYALSRGLAPGHLRGVYRQRLQWGLDTMRLFYWDNPLWKKGLTWMQRFHFLVIMATYLVSGLAFPLFYTVPLISYWQGYTCLAGQELEYAVLRGVYLLSTILMFRYLFRGKDAVKQFKILCGLFPVFAAASLAALFYPPGRKPAYKINNDHPFQTPGCWLALLPQLAFILLHFTFPFLSLHWGWASPQLVVFNAPFSAFTIWVLFDLVYAALSTPHWAPAADPKQVYGI